jgi:hypothetical protein
LSQQSRKACKFVLYQIILQKQITERCLTNGVNDMTKWFAEKNRFNVNNETPIQLGTIILPIQIVPTIALGAIEVL